MKYLALVMVLLVGNVALADDGGTPPASDAPVVFLRIDTAHVVPHGSDEPLDVGPGLYFDEANAIRLAQAVANENAQVDALSKAYDAQTKELQTKNDSPWIAAVIAGVVCLGGGIALGFALK